MRGPMGDPLRDPIPPGFPAPHEPSPVLREATSAVDSAAVRRSIAETDGLYRSKKPIFLALYLALGALGELLMIRPFLSGAFEISAAAVLGPLLAMIAFPLLAIGLYGLSTGAATAVQFQGPRVWLRTPLVYIPIALGLLIAAGTAA
ncbi:hypothetical protein Rhe02_41020 [Rhizocola hellebori]|uniref:Uncharacterized protein n=2 Tax=Rhizocola hellebori TaxID=1392758 RepID=A0A8J3QAI2_9ACTN|nr:hypothetical protein Rhe02_41020 [Rhizocola hellebori]